MSCSVQLKTRNSVKSKKVNNVIHRTTSETIRLGEPDLSNNSSRQLTRVISPPPLKQSCSFQVTSVSVTQRTDGGDDSADDLDESHTDDISRITDNETPSYSEDTCSRDAEDNYIGLCSALCSVTVIPSSSQYGLAIMPLNTSPVNTDNLSNSIVKAREDGDAVTESQNVSSSDIEVATTRFPGTRFKVVKVETSTPFRRGRWWCMDYLDQNAPKNAFTYKSSGGLEIHSQLQYTMTPTTTQAQPIENKVEFGTTSTILTQATDVTQSMCSVSEIPSLISHNGELLHHLPNVPAPNSKLKNNTNGAIPMSLDHDMYCKPCGQMLAKETHNFRNSSANQFASKPRDLMKSDMFSSVEALNFDLNSLMDLSLTNIIQNSIQEDCKDCVLPSESFDYCSLEASVTSPSISITKPSCHKTETVSSYLAWELFSQTPLKGDITTRNIFNTPTLHIHDNVNYCNLQTNCDKMQLHADSSSEHSALSISIKRQKSSPLESMTTSNQIPVVACIPITSQVNMSPTHKPFLDKTSSIDVPSTSMKAVAFTNDATSVMSTCPIMSSRFDIFDDISIVATRSIVDNFANSTATKTPSIVDKKIGEALDVVKERLQYVINIEVDVLRERISVLLDRITLLERENHFLKANADPDILRVLYGTDIKCSPSVLGNPPTGDGARKN